MKKHIHKCSVMGKHIHDCGGDRVLCEDLQSSTELEEVADCPKCGEEMTEHIIGDEIASRCPSCGFYTTE